MAARDYNCQSFKITIVGDDSLAKYMLMKGFFGEDRYDMDLFGPSETLM